MSPSIDISEAQDHASSRRLFFGLWPTGDVIPAISQCAAQAHSMYGGRIMRPETLHLTLAFLGSVNADKVRELVRLAPTWRVDSGRITLRRIGRFRGPGVVWAGPDEGQPEWLYGVYDRLWARLETLGWDRPDGPFRPHVSLLRNAGAGNPMACPPISWVTGDAVLVASEPQPGGSVYQALARVPVAA